MLFRSSPDSGDGPYLLSDDSATSICDVHNSSTNMLDTIESIPGVIKGNGSDKSETKPSTPTHPDSSEQGGTEGTSYDLRNLFPSH